MGDKLSSLLSLFLLELIKPANPTKQDPAQATNNGRTQTKDFRSTIKMKLITLAAFLIGLIAPSVAAFNKPCVGNCPDECRLSGHDGGYCNYHTGTCVCT
ncbi:unnamed protein product [Zymoseptoria tritici ST99CH_1A5]|uniref:Invertebrate defensins family profile domain-containing protein n=2 Tax=Zymoseptoria tritici TaxID=1047171 RepID=A0A2H1H8M7_ZYMTR|nr:unnamed protein product [Zymoseptoria tritici ST99CH_1E4]SMY30010.1 unnamed protein product [Zymoseptoria tritici ST99CH_1A5]